jgi:hypothetical protein
MLKIFKKISIKNFIIISLFGIFCVFPIIANAQLNNDDVSINISPEIPGPFEDVKISLISYSFSLDTSTITWKVDGKLALVGIGKKDFSFKTKGMGVKNIVSIQINTSNSKTITKGVVIKPEQIDLLWEAVDSYVPPFYKGKAIPVSESTIKIVAVPNLLGTSLKEESLIYSWKKDSKKMNDDSGYGKNYFTFKNSYMSNKNKIELSASSLDQSYTAKNVFNFTAGNPKILFYKENPEGIDYNNSLNTGFSFDQGTIKIIAEPYFFSQGDKNNNLNYEWVVDNRKIDLYDNVINLDSQINKNLSNISLSIKNIKKIFQETKQSISGGFSR